MELWEVYEDYITSLSTAQRRAIKKAIRYTISISIAIILILTFLYILQQVPRWQVVKFGITDPKELAETENSYRSTLAQILGGVAIGIGLYYTWRRVTIAEKELKVSQESQITERFTRAVDQLGAIDQLGNPAIEIRLGGMYALERIANESEKDYWPIMEILTAYVRKNSSFCISENRKSMHFAMNIQTDESVMNGAAEVREISIDIQTVLTILGRCKTFFYSTTKNHLNLRVTYLQGANLQGANLQGVNLEGANLEGANLEGANLKGANLEGANLKEANLEEANLKGANLKGADLQWANLQWVNYGPKPTVEELNIEKILKDIEKAELELVNFKGTNFEGANLKGANLKGADLKLANLDGANLEEANLEKANLEEAFLIGTHLEGAYGLSLYQLSNVKTLYNAKLDEDLLVPLKDKYPDLFKPPKYSTLHTNIHFQT